MTIPKCGITAVNHQEQQHIIQQQHDGRTNIHFTLIRRWAEGISGEFDCIPFGLYIEMSRALFLNRVVDHDNLISPELRSQFRF